MLNNLQRLICHKTQQTKLPLQVRVDLGVMVNKYSTFPKTPGLEFHHQMLECHIQDTLTRCPVGWACRIYQLLLCRGVGPPNECPGYDSKQSDGEVPVMLELHCHRSQVHSGPRVVAPDKGPIYWLNRPKPWFLDFTVFFHLNSIFMLN